MNMPTGVAVNAKRYVYVADPHNAQVEVVSPSGTLSVLAGQANRHGARPGFPTEGPAAQSALATPCAVALDEAGYLYIADPQNGVVERVDPAGTLTIAARIPGKWWSAMPDAAWDYEAAAEAEGGFQCGGLMGVAVDRASGIYIADFYNCVVVQLTPRGFGAGPGRAVDATA